MSARRAGFRDDPEAAAAGEAARVGLRALQGGARGLGGRAAGVQQLRHLQQHSSGSADTRHDREGQSSVTSRFCSVHEPRLMWSTTLRSLSQDAESPLLQVRTEFEDKWVSAGLQPTDQPAPKGEAAASKPDAAPAKAAGAPDTDASAGDASARHEPYLPPKLCREQTMHTRQHLRHRG